MDVTREKNQQGSAATTQQRTSRGISERAAQFWAALITMTAFGGLAAGLNALFTGMGGA